MSVFAVSMSLAAGLGLTVTALCAVIRIVRGPTILDRMVASDVLLTTLVLAAGMDMVIRGHTDSIPMMTVVAATATLATIVVARYVRRRGMNETGPPGLDDQPGETSQGAGNV
ncbi:hypothetical protein GCM10009847_27430 [Leucobacter tardus]|uniref:Sodium:proton antiporter n=1 Tax=Leucobacter tardus TaxID=501483 RepID=A0A939QL81_9MICO|nr:monovalent cation/H+ antiporter complex subunit F [Leucobacter tardus]MBO2989754.1 sodium:proton antiporter [Leucobacter tardus]